MENIQKIIQETQDDYHLQNTININEIIENGEQYDYLKDKTINTITKENFEKINDLNISQSKKKDWCEKLIGFRLINEIYELHKGKLIKVISKFDNTAKLQMKGKVVSIKFLDNGTHIICLLGANQYSQFLFNNYYIFQKLSLEEQIILQANEAII